MLCKLHEDLQDLPCEEKMPPLRPRVALYRAQWYAQFAHTAQHDAAEAWQTKLERLNVVDVDRLQALQMVVKPGTTPFWFTIGGRLQASIFCKVFVVMSLREREETFTQLDLQLLPQCHLPTLKKAMEDYSGEELVKGVHYPGCMNENTCGKFSRIPRVFTIFFKRWRQYRQKVQDHIGFPAK